MESEPEYQDLEDEVEFLMRYLDDMRRLLEVHSKETLENPHKSLESGKTDFLQKSWVSEFEADRNAHVENQGGEPNSAPASADNSSPSADTNGKGDSKEERASSQEEEASSQEEGASSKEEGAKSKEEGASSGDETDSDSCDETDSDSTYSVLSEGEVHSEPKARERIEPVDEQRAALSHWKWKKRALNCSYVYESVSIYRQLKAVLSQ